jgi:Glycosyl transferase family 2
MRPIRSWADMIEGYRPVAMAKPSSARSRRPKVSLCISAFQAERHLQATIGSCLAQHYAELELLIIDNDSSNGTRDILEAVKDDRVRIIRNATTLSVADHFNLAVQQSHGQFVKLMCAGDTLHPDCIAKQAKALEDNPEVTLVAVQTDHIDDEGQLFTRARGLVGLVGRHSGDRAIIRIVCRGANPIGPPVSVLFRRVDFDRCGGCRGEVLFRRIWIYGSGYSVSATSLVCQAILRRVGYTAVRRRSLFVGPPIEACPKGQPMRSRKKAIHRRRDRRPLSGSAGSARDLVPQGLTTFEARRRGDWRSCGI